MGIVPGRGVRLPTPEPEGGGLCPGVRGRCECLARPGEEGSKETEFTTEGLKERPRRDRAVDGS